MARFECNVISYVLQRTVDITVIIPTVTIPEAMLMYGKEASNRKQEIDCQHHTIPNQRNQKAESKLSYTVPFPSIFYFPNQSYKYILLILHALP
jgi:hypothetical protein